MSLYVVTGGAGFIGSNLVDELLKRGEAVRVIDNSSSGGSANIRKISDRLQLFESTVINLDACREAVAGADYVLHLAALCSIPRSINDLDFTAKVNSVNIGGTVNMLIASKEAAVKRFVCASSFSVYGNTPGVPKIESMTPVLESPYALTKHTQEAYCRLFGTIYALDTVVLRYFNVYGKRQDPSSRYAAVIPTFIKSLLNNIPPKILGDGKQTRDFTYIEDCIQATLLACTAPGAAGETFNVAFGARVSINALYSKLLQLLGKEIQPIYSAGRTVDIRDSWASIEKAKKILGYHPHYDIDAGLERTVEWYSESLQRG